MSDGQRDDGGPAFPIPIQFCPDGKGGVVMDSIEYAPRNGGMALRDWFAGQALAALASGIPDDEEHWGYGSLDRVLVRNVASAAYTLADAMLAARKGASQ